MQKKHYLMFVSLAYSYSILRPLQAEILRRGHKVAWYVEPGCPDLLTAQETRLASIDQVQAFNPIAVFAPGNLIYDFFPGVKVALFHGYPVGKRGEKGDVLDDHFTIRNWFDIYCSQGPSSTETFKTLEEQFGFFKVYETGWCKVDPFFQSLPVSNKDAKTILYSPTFSRGIGSAPVLFETIEELCQKKPWNWIITFHPKITDQQVIAKYKGLAERFPNVTFELNEGLQTFNRADAMLCDSSSIILEFMLLNKPVVTYRNTNPGPHLIDVTDVSLIEESLQYAMTKPTELMNNINAYTQYHEPHRDGQNSSRVLDAVDDFIENHKGHLKTKPRNWIRKLKLRYKTNYWKFSKN